MSDVDAEHGSRNAGAKTQVFRDRRGDHHAAHRGANIRSCVVEGPDAGPREVRATLGRVHDEAAKKVGSAQRGRGRPLNHRVEPLAEPTPVKALRGSRDAEDVRPRLRRDHDGP